MSESTLGATVPTTLDKPMKRQAYAKHLKKLLGDDAIDGQDVFHIIAESKGGANHPDNYLYALGCNFNRSIGNNYDDFNCFLAGLPKATKAVRISMDPKYKYTGSIGKFDPIKEGFDSSNPEDVAKHLFGRGQALMKHVRSAKKEQKKK